ncbi:MAG: amidohydrolase family protein [Bacteroidales bacterium]|nr:amidohydrolase family protein [Bacteroidales bacterium]
MRRIAARYIYTLENNEPLCDAFVEIEDDGTVVRTGICEDISSETEYYDGAIVPGFVNAHCHVELSHLKGKFRKGTGMAGFIDQINELRDTVGRDEKIADLAREIEGMWNSGVSAMADISNCNDSFAVKASSPMYIRTFIELFGTEPEDCDNIVEWAKGLKAEADEAGLDASITPHACYTMSPELLTAASAQGLSTGYLSYHSQESQEEEDMIASGTGKMAENRRNAGMSTPPVTGKPSLMYFIDRLTKVHAAPFDEHVLLVHNVCLTEEAASAALDVMKNVYWAVCPLSNIFIHDALPPIGLMRRLGLKIAVGTDSLSSNDSLDMAKEIYCLKTNFPEVPLGEILVWASRNGADFLSKSDVLGSIEPGKRPGLVLIDALDNVGNMTQASVSRRIV